ncbi:hypothetical protein HPE45_01610 [Escherichia coli]|nr:hypothetical protein [Escherichia coli]
MKKYYGKNVGLFGSDNLQENPYAVTGGNFLYTSSSD